MREHPSAYELEAWTVGEQTAKIEEHVQSCAQCRSYIDPLEIDRQEFLEIEDADEFLDRPMVCSAISVQTKEKKTRRRLEFHTELAKALFGEAEDSVPFSEGNNGALIRFNAQKWGLLIFTVLAVVVFLFFWA